MGKEPVSELVLSLTSSMTPYDVRSTWVNSNISALITQERENRKMDNKEFAELLGISPQKLKHWENGKHDFCIYEISYIMHKLGLDYKITVERVGDSQPN